MSSIDSFDNNRLKHRRYVVMALYGLSACWGVAQTLERENAIVEVAGAIAFATTATLWFTIDRRILAKPQLPILQLLFFCTWPVASLIHLVASRGLRGFGYWLLHAIGMFATMCLTFIPGALVLSWMGVIDLDSIQ